LEVELVLAKIIPNHQDLAELQIQAEAVEEHIILQIGQLAAEVLES
jgi:hypothetical protein